MKKTLLYIAWTQALVATLGSLFLSEVLHWTPCILCWYQRICMYPLVIILGVGILKEVEDIEFFVLPLTFIGAIISIYHNLLMYRVIPEALFPCAGGVSCTIPYHFWFNFLTVPLLALTGFVVITICMFVYRRKKV
jgi:disulfide bond formation protein DsbB